LHWFPLYAPLLLAVGVHTCYHFAAGGAYAHCYAPRCRAATRAARRCAARLFLLAAVADDGMETLCSVSSALLPVLLPGVRHSLTAAIPSALYLYGDAPLRLFTLPCIHDASLCSLLFLRGVSSPAMVLRIVSSRDVVISTSAALLRTLGGAACRLHTKDLSFNSMCAGKLWDVVILARLRWNATPYADAPGHKLTISTFFAPRTFSTGRGRFIPSPLLLRCICRRFLPTYPGLLACPTYAVWAILRF